MKNLIVHLFTAPTPSPNRTKEALERIAYEFCEDCKQQNVLYAEYRYNPFPLSEVPGSPNGREFCDAIITGLERGQKEFGVTVRSIVCFMRQSPGLFIIEKN
jgi:adenosine deaminase